MRRPGHRGYFGTLLFGLLAWYCARLAWDDFCFEVTPGVSMRDAPEASRIVGQRDCYSDTRMLAALMTFSHLR